MKDAIENTILEKSTAIENGANRYETGTVASVNSYIVTVNGLGGAAFGERVTVGRGNEGYVADIRPNGVVVTMMRSFEPVEIGDTVTATGKPYTASFSPESIGHVIDMFGTDKLEDRRFANVADIVIERPPIPIMDRGTVKIPMLTGIAGIDLLYPIGRGQRQLIIGDKKTGKTQIALDAIVNQRDKNMLCIYVAVGKTKKEVKDIYYQLNTRGAMAYTIILAAFNDENAPVLKSAPYVGVSIAEEFMLAGSDVLVVIDDLKRHADVYREMSLLMGKVPGRDAYPPDIFYSHASLLEKGCQHKDGGSITILPIVETRGGDITDYISTNIISITDGQIVLSTKAFEKGQKPAIQYGLSVSRLGGAVQTADMKKLGANIRRRLLSYLETRDIFELANMDEMGEELRNRMTSGKEILDKFNQGKFKVRSARSIVDDFIEYTR